MAGDRHRPKDGITRRQFLIQAGTAAGCVAVAADHRLLGLALRASAQGLEPTGGVELPVPMKAGAPRPKVVHVRSSEATAWDFASGWYGDFVSQEAVSRMVDRGLQALTGTSSRVAAWQALLPDYAPGQKVAIKVNLNNARSLGDSDQALDALIEPVNSIVAGLKAIGMAETAISVYDAVRSIPDRFRGGCDYSGVQFSGKDVNTQGFSVSERVKFEPPAGGLALADQPISQVLVNADYLINMPIMKKHSRAQVTLSFKNHFGSIENCRALHDAAFPASEGYRPDYNPLVDIYRNPHFGAKTVLTIGDGLYGSRDNQGSPPGPWLSFDNRAPNSLFFSRDPVAIDCVMADFLGAEAGVPEAADDYLVLAAQKGLGVFERRAAGASWREAWYSLIDYAYLDLDAEPSHHAYLPFSHK